MSPQGKATQQSPAGAGFFNSLWRYRAWWLLPLGVLFLLLATIYVLGRLSRTDSEMYPTTMQQNKFMQRGC